MIKIKFKLLASPDIFRKNHLSDWLPNGLSPESFLSENEHQNWAHLQETLKAYCAKPFKRFEDFENVVRHAAFLTIDCEWPEDPELGQIKNQNRLLFFRHICTSARDLLQPTNRPTPSDVLTQCCNIAGDLWIRYSLLDLYTNANPLPSLATEIHHQLETLRRGCATLSPTKALQTQAAYYLKLILTLPPLIFESDPQKQGQQPRRSKKRPRQKFCHVNYDLLCSIHAKQGQVAADGDCLFAAFNTAAEMSKSPRDLRQKAVSYLSQHPSLFNRLYSAMLLTLPNGTSPESIGGILDALKQDTLCGLPDSFVDWTASVIQVLLLNPDDAQKHRVKTLYFEAYQRIMSQNGVFGGDLEFNALCLSHNRVGIIISQLDQDHEPSTHSVFNTVHIHAFGACIGKTDDAPDNYELSARTRDQISRYIFDRLIGIGVLQRESALYISSTLLPSHFLNNHARVIRTPRADEIQAIFDELNIPHCNLSLPQVAAIFSSKTPCNTDTPPVWLLLNQDTAHYIPIITGPASAELLLQGAVNLPVRPHLAWSDGEFWGTGWQQDLCAIPSFLSIVQDNIGPHARQRSEIEALSQSCSDLWRRVHLRSNKLLPPEQPAPNRSIYDCLNAWIGLARCFDRVWENWTLGPARWDKSLWAWSVGCTRSLFFKLQGIPLESKPVTTLKSEYGPAFDTPFADRQTQFFDAHRESSTRGNTISQVNELAILGLETYEVGVREKPRYLGLQIIRFAVITLLHKLKQATH